ncbi:MAG: TonB family protein [Gemmatimonadaceae bacterium]
MIAAWMLGSTLFALLLCIAAFAIERVLRITQRPTRTPWVISLILAVVWPAIAPVVLRQMSADDAATPFFINNGAASPASFIAGQFPAASASWEELAAKILMVVWGVVSFALIARLCFAARALSRVTRSAQQIQLDGGPVLVTETLGPAVIGLWTPRVAVPEWFLQLDASLRALVLRHEREHCASRDPQLVWLASLAIAVMPWNIGVWILSRRLRLALEIDCDSRTLRREANTERYGKLLLLIAQRQSSYPLASMLAESTSHLSRRITAMQMTPLRKPAARVVGYGLLASAAIIAACSQRVASDLTGPARPANMNVIGAKQAAEAASGGTVYYESQVEQPVTAVAGSPGPKFPESLKAAGRDGQVLAMFVVNEQGIAETKTLKILRSDDSLLTAAVVAALPTMQFTAARIGGKAVKQLVQQPFMFSTNRAPAGTGAKASSRNADGSASTAKLVAGNADAASPRRTPPPHVEGQPYFESQVEKPAGYKLGSKGPVYPADLKANKIEGRVLAMFVVNEDGSVDMSSFKVLKSDHTEFEAAVRDAVVSAQFTPALIGGKAVKQLVQQPFQFSLSK